MTQKHNTHVRTLPPTNHSTTTNHEEKRIDSTDCPAATGRNCPAPFHQRGRKKMEKEKMETKDYLPEVHGTIRAKYEYQTTMGAGRFEVRNARVSVTGNVLPSVAYKAEIDLSDEGQSRCWMPTPGFSDKRTDSHRRTNACSLHHRCPPLTAPAILPQPVVHRQASGQCTGCRIHSRIYPAHRCTYHRGRRLQRFRTDQPERMAQGSKLLGQSPVPLHQRTEPDTERAEHPTGRITYAILRASVPTMKPAVSTSKANTCTSDIPTMPSKMYMPSTLSSTTICRYGKYSTKCLSSTL